MPSGRSPKGPELVDRFDGSDNAKDRLRVILSTITGQMSVAEACQELGIKEARFYQLRDEAMKGALAGLEPSWRGRPPKDQTIGPEEAKALKAHADAMEYMAKLAEIRLKVATLMPNEMELPPWDEDPLNPEVQDELWEKKLKKAKKKAAKRRGGKKLGGKG